MPFLGPHTKHSQRLQSHDQGCGRTQRVTRGISQMDQSRQETWLLFDNFKVDGSEKILDCQFVLIIVSCRNFAESFA